MKSIELSRRTKIQYQPIWDLLNWFDMDLPLVKTTMHTHTCTQLNGAQRGGGSTVKRKFTNLGDDVVANGHNFDAAKILSISIFKRKKRSFSCRAEYEITSTSISMNIKLQLLDTSSAIQLKPLPNKKCQKNFRYPTKTQSFSKEKDCFLEKDCFFVGYLKFLWPFLF